MSFPVKTPFRNLDSRSAGTYSADLRHGAGVGRRPATPYLTPGRTAVQVRREVQTDETLPLSLALPLAVQHLMAMFGATVLVPILTGLDPGIGLMTSGVGTLLYLALTRGKIPSYLGSSFAFIAPLIVVGGGVPGGPNIPYALGGLVAAGLVYVVIAAIVRAFG